MIIYLGVEDFILRRTARHDSGETPFELVPYGFGFLTWVIERSDCRWLSRLNPDGMDGRIRAAFRVALGMPERSGELDLLFEMINGTYWEAAKVEGIDLDSDFCWITRNVDRQSLEVLERRQMTDRLIICSPDVGAEEFAKIQLRLEAYAS